MAATGLSLTQAWRTYSATTTPQVRRLSTLATDKALNPRVVGPGRRRSEGGHLTPLSPPTGVLTRIRDPRLAIASRPVFRNRNGLRARTGTAYGRVPGCAASASARRPLVSR